MPIPFYSACFYSTDNGATVGRRVNAAENQFAGLPNNLTNLLRLDPSQPNNAALLAAWAVDASQFTMSGNTLLQNGQPCGIDEPSLLFRAMENADALYTKANSTPDAFTREEQAQQMALNFRSLGLIPAL